jgi:A/G-specific adenine glycosylase
VVTDRQTTFRPALLKWGQGHQRNFPWRERDRSFYEVFVAEFLLTQTPAENVATVYPRFVD